MLELLIVLFIATILLVAVVPSERAQLDRSEAEIASAQLLHAIHLARLNAMTRGMSTFLEKDQEWQQGYRIRIAEKILYTFHPINNTNILHWRGARDTETIQFLPSGMTNIDNGTFWYCHNTHPAFAILLNSAGRARVLYPNSDNEIKDGRGKAFHC